MRIVLILVILHVYELGAAANAYRCLSPTAMVSTSDGKALFVACGTASQLLRMDVATKRVQVSIALPMPASGLALSRDGQQLFVTCAAPESHVYVVDLRKMKITAAIATGHSSIAPVTSVDGKTLYVCNQFDNDVSIVSLAARKEVGRIAVQREPVAADITEDGKYVLVANQIPTGRADADYVAAIVSMIDVAAGKVTAEFVLPDGSGSLKDIRVSPDGKFAAVTHVLAQFRLPAVDLHSRWINANALTLIDIGRKEVVASTLLDDRNCGAGNPWGLAWSADGATLVVAHAGTSEVSIIDFPALLKTLLALPAPFDALNVGGATIEPYPASAYSVPLFSSPRQRIKLPNGDFGPRAVTIVGQTAYVANYFSDNLTAIDLTNPKDGIESIPLGPKAQTSAVRQGELYFHDATICLEGWQSCSSCHPGGARVDGLNWDLPNDGIGNPKNTKSLLLAYQTAPMMSLGVRENAEAAVRAGIEHILFTKQSAAVASAIDEYLKSLKPVSSPHLVHGEFSKSARRGKKVFRQAGCSECHVPGLFTDLRSHDVGTRRTFDNPTDEFYTPTLIEVWRTAPYLHDGSAATMRDVFTTRNPSGKHGDTGRLSKQAMDDLYEYVLSL